MRRIVSAESHRRNSRSRRDCHGEQADERQRHASRRQSRVIKAAVLDGCSGPYGLRRNDHRLGNLRERPRSDESGRKGGYRNEPDAVSHGVLLSLGAIDTYNAPDGSSVNLRAGKPADANIAEGG